MDSPSEGGRQGHEGTAATRVRFSFQGQKRTLIFNRIVFCASLKSWAIGLRSATSVHIIKDFQGTSSRWWTKPALSRSAVSRSLPFSI